MGGEEIDCLKYILYFSGSTTSVDFAQKDYTPPQEAWKRVNKYAKSLGAKYKSDPLYVHHVWLKKIKTLQFI